MAGDVEKQEPAAAEKGPEKWPRLQHLLRGRVEGRGIVPVPPEERTSRRYFNVFTIWLSMNTNILALTFGMLGPTVYGLGLRDASLVILFFTLLTAVPPAFLGTLGPATGMRQMIQARFSFGRYLVSLPVLCNLATMTGFCVIICVVGGQCIAAVSSSVSPNLGIAIVALCAMLISFFGFGVLHWFETVAWAPSLLTIAIAAGCGGSHLAQQPVPAPTASAPAVLSFGMIVASYMMPWACLASDFTTYFDPAAPAWRLFVYGYAGVATPTVLLMVLGAAVGGAIAGVPAWSDAFEANMVGGVLAAMLAPAGGFGKFVVVLLALSLVGNVAGTTYALTLNFQTLVPGIAAKVPRYVFAAVVTAAVVPVAVRAAADFFANLENLVSLIGYWSAAFVGVVTAEHLAFRRGADPAYDPAIWDDGSALPPGIAAVSACVLSFGLVVPCMAQVWWTGPLAEVTGDIGFEVALFLSAVLYLPLRWAEKGWGGR